ncbi:peptidoglycan DD-metalloendopeptidase family protein [Candidatus Poriferisocius sp.]|uniref:peptidoglycan DD-metalloendopeptidase family protein n=1 Tax=Candidatus Poriferisocius sp. TaxID=3101276 RepID=UPI003B018F3F
MYKLLRIVCLIAVLLPLALSTPSAAQDSFFEERERQIEEKKREIEERQREQDALKRQSLFAIEELNVTQAQIEEVDAALAEVNNWIAAAVTRLQALELSQTAAQERVNAARERDSELDDEIAAIQERLRDQVVDIYLDLVYEQNFLLQDGDPNRNARRKFYIEELGADAQVLIDRLRQAKDDQQIAIEQAVQAQAEIEQAQAEIEAALADLAELRTAQKKLQDEWNRKKQELEERIAAEAQVSLEIENEIAGLDQDIESIEDEIERERERRHQVELERQRQAELARLAELERKRQAELDALTALERLGQYDEIGIPPPPEFIQPVPGTIGSGYGNRIHPIFGTLRFHAGVDYAGNTGDPIQASAPGVVIQVQSRTGYGNTVIIDHGGGWSTLYAHLSRFDVSVNDRVAYGETIGGVGNTGWSTGPHLHFEIRYKGSPLNPENYL